MKVEIAPPPILDQILKVFPDASKPGVIFAYGDTIFNPGGSRIPAALIAHESVHGERQLAMAGGIEAWWDKYLSNPVFRYQEELAAHIAEAVAQWPADRNRRQQLVMSTAQRLIAPLYNYGIEFQPSLRTAMGDLADGIREALTW